MSASQGMDTQLMCETSPELKKKVKALRFNQTKTTQAIIIKIKEEGDVNKIISEEELEDITLEEIGEELPECSPRFVVYSYELTNDEGRKSYPFVFIYYNPHGCKPEMAMKYAGSKVSLSNEFGMTKVYDIQDREELTESWLRSQLTR